MHLCAKIETWIHHSNRKSANYNVLVVQHRFWLVTVRATCFHGERENILKGDESKILQIFGSRVEKLLLYPLLYVWSCFKRNSARFGALNWVMGTLGKLRRPEKSKKSRLSHRATLPLFSRSSNFLSATITHYKITCVARTLWLDELHFPSEYKDTLTSFSYCIRVQRHGWRQVNSKKTLVIL